ncbi:MAG: hypothetical protein IJW93_06065 [Clostridia bacterium]|nr:hypothetical protein [Clostridia bacterium]
MDGMLQAIIVVFMLFLCSLCLFAIVVIVRDIIHEHSQKKQQKEEPATSINAEELSELIARAATALADARESESAEELAEAPAEPVAEPAPADKPEDENAVVFSRATLSLEEKYATLSTEYKRFFDDIIKHALGKEGVRELKYENYYDYKIGSYKVLRIAIKRGEIVCEFQFLDRDVLDYANNSGVKIKQSASSIRVTEPSAVGAIKDGIDLVCTQIAEDKEHKKALAREKRREKRRKEKEENEAEAPVREEVVNV